MRTTTNRKSNFLRLAALLLVWVIIGLVPFTATAQRVGWDWALRMGGSNTNTQAESDQLGGMATDIQGNSYVTGGFDTRPTFDNTTQTIQGAGQLDFFVVSYDSAGGFR